MSQCTCTKDAQMTCIVHPTESSLKARIAELKSARKDWEHQKWLLEMELERYIALSDTQRGIIHELRTALDNKSVAQ